MIKEDINALMENLNESIKSISDEGKALSEKMAKRREEESRKVVQFTNINEDTLSIKCENGFYHISLLPLGDININGETIWEHATYSFENYGLRLSGTEIIKKGSVVDKLIKKEMIISNNYVINL